LRIEDEISGQHRSQAMCTADRHIFVAIIAADGDGAAAVAVTGRIVGRDRCGVGGAVPPPRS
jgi:hypothetical protein